MVDVILSIVRCKFVLSKEAKVMASRDQIVGGGVLAIAIVVAIVYLYWFFLTPPEIAVWAVKIPVLIVVLAVLGIAGWIGWTMATTPPPKPVEELIGEEISPSEETKEEKPAEAGEAEKKEQ